MSVVAHAHVTEQLTRPAAATSPSGSMPYGALGGRLCSFNDADAAAQESTTHESALLDSEVH